MSGTLTFWLERGDLSGSSCGKLTLSARELRRRSERREQRAAIDPLEYIAPPCDRPAPEESVRAWEAFHAPGPGDPGDALYLSGGGEGHLKRYREARATYYWRGGGRSALELAAEHGDWENREMILLLLSTEDITAQEAMDLQRRGCPLKSDEEEFAKLVQCCARKQCEGKHYHAGLCQKHWKGRK